jgi:hypothetical protein
LVHGERANKNVSGTYATDAALDQFKQHACLEILILEEPRLSGSAVKDLRIALPDLDIHDGETRRPATPRAYLEEIEL